MTPDLPPPTTPLLTAAINDATMPAALFRSYARLYAAAWRSNFRHTPALEFDRELVPLLGVRRSQARQHLRLLRFARLLEWSSDGSNRYTIHFSPGLPRGYAPGHIPDDPAAVPDSGGGVGQSLDLISESVHQQQTQSDKTVYQPTGGRTEADPTEVNPTGTEPQADEAEEAVRGYLLAAGVWPDVSQRIAGQIAFNEQRTRQQGDQHYLPTQADVLGWIAYCFADRKKNNIGAPAAVLAANLNANRRCPDEYRPEPVCAACHLELESCACETPQPHFPDDFLELAFQGRSPYSLNRTLWGVCTLCRGHPCQCG